MRPLLLHGHGRPVTCVTFNKDGDLLFSSAKDKVPTCWHTSNGERIGTYDGHTGSVYYVDVSDDSRLLLTASADQTARVWEVETGKELFQFEIDSACRCVKWSHDQTKILAVQDNALRQQTKVWIFEIDDQLRLNLDPSNQSKEPIQVLVDETIQKKLSRAVWFANDTQILTSGDDGFLRRWDVATGSLTQKFSIQKVSPQPINNLRLSNDGHMLITANAEHTAKVFDSRTFEEKMTYNSDRPINGAAISPLAPVVLIGGGQAAIEVTMTANKSGKFETFYYHLIYENLLGSTKGHFGPINDLVMLPDGKGFATGGEDSYVRLHYFDSDFLEMCDTLEK